MKQKEREEIIKKTIKSLCKKAEIDGVVIVTIKIKNQEEATITNSIYSEKIEKLELLRAAEDSIETIRQDILTKKGEL